MHFLQYSFEGFASVLLGDRAVAALLHDRWRKRMGGCLDLVDADMVYATRLVALCAYQDVFEMLGAPVISWGWAM